MKFRVFDKKCKTMHQVGTDIHDSLRVDENGNLYYYNMQNGESSKNEDSNYILMPNIGLTAMNAEDVFDGDIVTVSWYSYIEPIDDIFGCVKYIESAFVITDTNACTKWDSTGFNEYDHYLREIFVHGNIHENPELLSEEEEPDDN